jgi:sulfite reductase (NADPH) flavoprotein alpha-component
LWASFVFIVCAVFSVVNVLQRHFSTFPIMHLQPAESNGPAPEPQPVHAGPKKALKEFKQHSTSLPFGQPASLASIGGPTYVTAQTLIQQVAYSLSDRLWTYSPDTFDLDVAVKGWFEEGAKNVYGYSTNVEAMQIRQGAASIALGYIFSKDFDLKRRYVPQSILASSSTLQYLRAALDQLSLLYSVANPFVAHIAAIDYAGASSRLVSDYVSALSVAEELGFCMVSSLSVYEAQHMSLFSTLLASICPTIHIYDGVSVGRETSRVIDVLDQAGLHNTYKAVQNEISEPGKKNADLDTKVQRLLNAFNGELGTQYGLFEYHGHATPDSVLVVFGTVESSLASQVASLLERDGARIGVLNVRVYRPFVEQAFLNALPESVRTIGVLGQVHNPQAVSDNSVRSNLYGDVMAAVRFSDKRTTPPAVIDVKYPRETVWTPISIAAAFQLLVKKPLLKAVGEVNGRESSPALQLLDPNFVQQYTFWDIDTSNSANAPVALGQALATNSANNVTMKTGYDNLLQGGVFRTDIRKSQKSIEASYSVDAADVAYVGEQSLLNKFDVLNGIKAGGKIMLKLPGVKDDDVEGKLPVEFRKALAAKATQLYIFDPPAVDVIANDPPLETYLAQIAFLRVALPSLEKVGLQKLASVNGTIETIEELAKVLDNALRQIEIPESWANAEIENPIPALPKDINVSSFAAFDKIEVEPPTYLKDWKTAAKGLAFKEAYATKTALRPDLTVKNYTVHVQENRRLTPPSYDRNIFHIEFDLGDSSLKYDIGEALGIHAENDEVEVNDFIKFYKLDPEEIVEVPSRENQHVLENRTVYQALMQNVDIFGKPPKRFYEALTEFADDPAEKTELTILGGPTKDGNQEFKRRAEVDTITYADVLLEFPSAHPSFHEIVRIVSPMKRREYSIASCQKVTPNSVALMIVVVGWIDPKGRDRFGQATRFLNRLRVGAPVTVSVKPSVMKLPPKSTQPLIMAGLGTGLAPFRAFVQHRAWEKAQGKEIGAVLLYMGSRHQREEYCYGEEWEAYQDAGVITLLGRAFSRDQPQKIYIQDRMRQTMNDIIQAYLKEEGAFYLCEHFPPSLSKTVVANVPILGGPTWPVPDVTNVLEDAIFRHAKSLGKKTNPRTEIEKLKDQLRYVLEVY